MSRQIHFGPSNRICGALIKTYLLEKSRCEACEVKGVEAFAPPSLPPGPLASAPHFPLNPDSQGGPPAPWGAHLPHLLPAGEGLQPRRAAAVEAARGPRLVQDARAERLHGEKGSGGLCSAENREGGLEGASDSSARSPSLMHLAPPPLAQTIERVDDAQEFTAVVQAMRDMGIEEGTRSALFGLLSGVLWLGNVEMQPKHGEHDDESTG